MAQAKCPVCGCDTFYCKNPEDEYDTKTFSVVDGSAVPSDPEDDDWSEDMTSETEAYCDRCTWHAPFGDVTKR